MKKMLLTAVCAGVLYVAGVAVVDAKPLPLAPDGEGPKLEMKIRQPLAEKLKLTDEQKAQADKIREDGRKKMKPLIEERKELRKKMDAVRKANMEEFEKILTPEQKKAFDEMKKHKRPHQGIRPRLKGPNLEKHHRPAPELAPGGAPVPDVEEAE